MSTISKWNTYLKERSPIPALAFISAGGAMSSMAFQNIFQLKYLLLGIVVNTLIFIQLRLGDELKDFDKDKIINPERPLPRGLLTTYQVYSALVNVLIFLIIVGCLIGLLQSWPGGIGLILTTGFAWLMFKEFYISSQLSKEPMLYALTHQVIVFPLYAWLGLTIDPELLSSSTFQGWLIANFGASFTFEICRKLKPDAHELAQTYAHHYGPRPTVLFCFVFIAVALIGSIMGNIVTLTALPLMILTFVLIRWIKKPATYKQAEGISALSAAIILWAPALMWLFKRWS